MSNGDQSLGQPGQGTSPAFPEAEIKAFWTLKNWFIGTFSTIRTWTNGFIAGLLRQDVTETAILFWFDESVALLIFITNWCVAQGDAIRSAQGAVFTIFDKLYPNHLINPLRRLAYQAFGLNTDDSLLQLDPLEQTPDPGLPPWGHWLINDSDVPAYLKMIQNPPVPPGQSSSTSGNGGSAPPAQGGAPPK